MHYRNASASDLDAVARIFLAAFPESVEHYVGRTIRPDAIRDAFEICLEAEPDAFIVADLRDEVIGYIFAPAKLSGIYRYAFSHAASLRMIWRWISGRYGVGIRPALLAARNQFYVWRDANRVDSNSGDARIFSIAVDPRYSGRGVGAGLVQAGLHYLAEQRVERVRLEVRSDNAVAIHIYRKYGFREAGHTSDTQGGWLIMLKEMHSVDEE